MKFEKRFKFVAAMALFISLGSYAGDIKNYVGLSGKFTDDGSAVLSVAEQVILPDGWLAFFDNDNLRNFPIEWTRGESWQNYLNTLGEKYYIAIIIDGSNRRVYFAKPSGMFVAGSHVLNPNSLVHAQNTVLKEIIRKAEVNLSRYEQREIARQMDGVMAERQRLEATIAELEQQKTDLKMQLGTSGINAQAVPMRNESNMVSFAPSHSVHHDTTTAGHRTSIDSSKPMLPPGLPAHSTPGSDETLYQSLNQPSAMPSVNSSPYGAERGDTPVPEVAQHSGASKGLYADTQESFSFKVYQGLVIADNLKRMSEFIDYDIHLRNVPDTCDFESFANETLTGRNKLAMFREYANRYFFAVDAQPAMNPDERGVVVLTYNGDSHVFEGCMK